LLVCIAFAYHQASHARHAAALAFELSDTHTKKTQENEI
jgi:hypothetical protein